MRKRKNTADTLKNIHTEREGKTHKHKERGGHTCMTETRERIPISTCVCVCVMQGGRGVKMKEIADKSCGNHSC